MSIFPRIFKKIVPDAKLVALKIPIQRYITWQLEVIRRGNGGRKQKIYSLILIYKQLFIIYRKLIKSTEGLILFREEADKKISLNAHCCQSKMEFQKSSQLCQKILLPRPHRDPWAMRGVQWMY